MPASKNDITAVGKVRRWRNSPAGRAIMALVALVAVALSAYYVVSKLAASLRQITTMHLVPRWSYALAALAVTLVCVFLGGIIWHLVLRGVGQDLGWRTCMRAHLLANLGGYLPGYGWKFVGKAYLIQRAGVPVAWVSFAVLLEFAGLAVSRAVVALSALPPAFLNRFGWEIKPGALWLSRSMAWALLLAVPWLLQILLRYLPQAARLRRTQIRPRPLALASLLMCFTWLLYGLGFALLTRAIFDVGPEHLASLVFSTTTSFLVSLLMFFVPAGLGVRESVLIFTLEGLLPDAIITLGALLSRVVLIIAEVLGALAGSWMGLRERLCK